MVLKTIEKLSQAAPDAVFTKAEAVCETWKIMSIIEDTDSDDYNKLLSDINLTTADFDTDCPYDLLLDDVRFVTWDTIDAVISARLAEMEEKEAERERLFAEASEIDPDYIVK
jgi:hypothetical protein